MIFRNCNKVRRKEGSGQGWLVKTQVFLLTQINSHRCALCVTWTHQLSRLSQRSLSVFVPAVSLLQLVRPSLHSVSLNELPFHGGFYPVSTPITAIRHRWSSFCTWPTYLDCLLSLSPAADFAEPRPPRHIPPPPDSGQEALRPAASPPFLERKSATVICVPGLWITLNLKGCNARYQRVIRALVSFMRWSHCKGAWSEQRVNSLSQEIIAEGEDRPPDRQTLLLNGAVHRLFLRELPTDVQHRALLTPYLLGQDSSQPPVRRVRLQQEGERKVRRVQ